MLPEDDIAYLDANFPGYQMQHDNGMTCVIIPRFPVPAGYTVECSDLLLRIGGLYPDTPPDMWWFEPWLELSSGQGIVNADVREDVLGRNWQRWSRHLTQEQWLSGIDGLHSYIQVIRQNLKEAAGAV